MAYKPRKNRETASGDVDRTAKKPKIKLPEGYSDEAEFLQEMRQLFYDDVQADRLNREAALEDLRFLVGDQWDDITRQRREAARKPVLTINRLPAFVAQVVGSRKQNETVIKISPDNGGTKDVARVREGIVRSIQKISRADACYDNALLGAVAAGLGAFKVELVQSTNDIWLQEIAVKPVPDHLAVVWDRMLTEPTGRDADHCFELDSMPQKDFYRTWPWATPADVVTDVSLRGDLRMTGWIAIDDVRVVNYWRMRTRICEYALLNNGMTVNITEFDENDPDDAAALKNIVLDEEGAPYIREVVEKYAQLYVCSGTDVLDGPYNLPIDRVPIFRVPGWEVKVGDWMHRWGLVRFLKDPQRMHNYWRSAIAEKMMQTPRGVWAAADTAVAGREAAWRSSHLTDDPLLIWNAESGQKPERIMPAQFEQAMLGQSEMTNQDIKDVSNIHEANLGMPSNEVSGAAITARERVSDTGTILYHDNLSKAIEEAGRVMNDLIPVAYDTMRVVKIIGEDGKEDMQVINAFGNDATTDVTVGKYAVTATTGPASATKRLESAQAMQNLATAMPQVLAVAADLIVEAQDWPGAQKIAKRLRANMPPGVVPPDELTPEEQQKAQAAQSAQGMQAQIALAAANSKIQAQNSQTVLNLARARNFSVQSGVAQAKVQQGAVSTASQAADRELRGRLEAVRVATGK